MARAGYGDLEVGAETSSVQAVHPVGTEAAPGIAFSTDTDVGLYRAGANQLGVSVSGTGQVVIVDGALQPVTTNDIDLGTADLQFKNAWFDGALEADAITVGGVSVATGTNATTFTITAVSDDDTVYPVFVTGTSGSNAAEVDTGFTFNPSTNVLTAPGEIDAASLDISGDADIDGTMEADAYTVDGATLAEYISDTVGAMVGSNTETNIAVTYDDSDNTLDFVVASDLNTTGTAAGLSATLAVASGGTGITSLGTGVATFMGTPSSANLRSALTDETGTGGAVFATSPTLVTPVLGTPASGNLTNCTNAGKTVGFIIAMA